MCFILAECDSSEHMALWFILYWYQQKVLVLTYSIFSWSITLWKLPEISRICCLNTTFYVVPPPHLLNVSFFPWLKLNFWPLIIFYLLLVVLMYNQYQLIPWKWDFQRFNHIHVYIRFNSSYVHKIMFKRSFFFKLQTLIASQFRQTKLIVQSNVAIRGYSGPIQH